MTKLTHDTRQGIKLVPNNRKQGLESQITDLSVFALVDSTSVSSPSPWGGSVHSPCYSDPAVVSDSPTILLEACLCLASHLTSLFSPITFLKELSTVLSPDTSSLCILLPLSGPPLPLLWRTEGLLNDSMHHSLLLFLIMPEALQCGLSHLMCLNIKHGIERYMGDK